MTDYLQRVRSDALPENTTYADDGCSLAPRCLQCPLAVCRYDLPNGMATLKAAARTTAAARLYRTGLGADAIADRVGVSRRTVFRMLALRSGSHHVRMSAKGKRAQRTQAQQRRRAREREARAS